MKVTSLGSPPLCEASAAHLAPWNSGLVLVADNEESGALFSFSPRRGRLTGQRALPLPPGAPRDIEALTQIGSQLLVVGSFSRNRQCEVKPARQRMMVVEFDPTGVLTEVSRIDGAAAMAAAARDVEGCLGALFVQPPPAGAREVCEALVEAERRAAAGEGCDTLDIEGAVTLPSTPARLWLGLRGPLVGTKAVLLRHVAPLEELRFDAVTLLELGGRGVRELHLDGTTVRGIAGPQGDGEGDFRLFSITAERLIPGETVSPVLHAQPLPRSSEGLAVHSDRLYVVTDGERASRNACAQAASQTSITIRTIADKPSRPPVDRKGSGAPPRPGPPDPQ